MLSLHLSSLQMYFYFFYLENSGITLNRFKLVLGKCQDLVIFTDEIGSIFFANDT